MPQVSQLVSEAGASGLRQLSLSSLDRALSDCLTGAVQPLQTVGRGPTGLLCQNLGGEELHLLSGIRLGVVHL